MKTCPYCAEEIKDAAIRCRWCQMWLVETVPAGAEGPPPKAAERKSGPKEAPKPAPQATVLQAIPPSESKPAQPAAAEVKPVASAPAAQAPPPTVTPPAQAPPAAQPAPAQAAPAAQPAPLAQPAPVAQAAPAAQSAPVPAADSKVEFTHTGSRYLLGYGGDYFGIWDRNSPQQPLERFPRNDQGWGSAWARYAAIETNWMDLRSGQKSG